MLIASCSSHCAQRVVPYLPTFLCFHPKCGSSIYRCTLDIKNRTELSHYAWNLLGVCECDESNCCDVHCLNSQRHRGAMTCIVWTPFALTRLCPEGKCPDMAASRRKMPCHTPSGKQMAWRAESGRTVPWRSACELSRLRPKCPECLVRPDAKDTICFFLMLPRSGTSLASAPTLGPVIPTGTNSGHYGVVPMDLLAMQRTAEKNCIR